MKTVIFGGTGGLGKQLQPHFPDALFLGSRDVNVSVEEQVRAFFEKTQVDVVVNLSGYNHDGFLHRQDTHQIECMLDVNVRGTLNIVRHCLPRMRARKYGRIILVSSFLAATPLMGTSVYAATKSFIDGLVKTCAIENAREYVTCNSIRLGYFDGGMTHKIENWETLKHSIPMRRLGKVEELANTIHYIVKTEYLTGATIDLTGGL